MYDKNSSNSQNNNYFSHMKNNSDTTQSFNFALKDPKNEFKETAKNINNNYKRKFQKVNPTHLRSNSHNILF